MTDRVPMITRSLLKSERGWTEKLLKKFLPAPDVITDNPNYRSGPPMLLFKVESIDKIENTAEFKIAKEGTAKFKISAKKAIETKLERLRKYLDTVQIELPLYDKVKLVKKACSHYNKMQNVRAMEGRTNEMGSANINSDEKFLQRICVNYLRHCLTGYEQYLDEISGKVGFSEGYLEIRHKIFSKISENYSWLADECSRQEDPSRHI